MAFSESGIKLAGVLYSNLLNVHMHRKEFENRWVEQGETILEPTTVNFPDIQGNTLLDYAIILGDIEKIDMLISQGAKSKTAVILAKASENEYIINKFPSTPSPSEDAGLTPLMRALKAKDISRAKKLIDQGANVNQIYENTSLTALDFAVSAESLEAVMYLVEHGAKLDGVNTAGANFIEKAIRSENVGIVKYALSLNVDYSIHDYYGKTPLHYAAECKNPEIVNLILNDERFSPLIKTKDLLGRDPLQIAIDVDNTYFTNQVNVPTDRKKNENTLIAQNHIIKALQYYLRLTNQNPFVLYDLEKSNKSIDELSISGQCNGLGFLFLLFCEKGQKKEFFNMLKVISKWNGTYESLDDNTAVSDLNDKYDSVGEFFRYFTDHVVLLQQTNINEELKSVNPTQRSRIEQHQLISEQGLPFERHFHIDTRQVSSTSFFSLEQVNPAPLNKSQLSEYISILNRLPKTMSEINSLNHTTDLYVDAQDNLSYYDSNMLYELEAIKSVKTLASLIHLEKPIEIVAYKAKDFNKDDYVFFSNHELPKNKEASIAYQNNSPNKFTHLHIAVLSDSLRNVNKILSDGAVDVNAKDIRGDTALDLAIKNNKPSIAEVLIRQLSQNRKVKYSNSYCEKIIQDCLNFKNNEFLVPFLDLAEAPSNLNPELLINAIESGNVMLAKKLFECGISPDFEIEIYLEDWTSVLVTARGLAEDKGMHDLIKLFANKNSRVTSSPVIPADSSSTRVQPVIVQYDKNNSGSKPQADLDNQNNKKHNIKPK